MHATLAIQLEACLQEELAAQTAMQAALAAVEAAARAGSQAELARQGARLEELLAPAAQREARRNALLDKLTAALGLRARERTLGRLLERLAAAGHETARLAQARAELREAVQRTHGASRRLSALAQFHRGLLEEVLQAVGGGAGTGGHLVDARG